jgi:hypothetical protein
LSNEQQHFFFVYSSLSFAFFYRIKGKDFSLALFSSLFSLSLSLLMSSKTPKFKRSLLAACKGQNFPPTELVAFDSWLWTDKKMRHNPAPPHSSSLLIATQYNERFI